MSKHDLDPARHEADDVSARFVWAGAATVMFAVMFFAALVLWLFPGSLVDRTLHLPLTAYPAPELQTDPAAEMTRFYREEMTQLNSSGWIDQSAGRAHIPIAQAMRLVAEDGISGWPGAPEGATLAKTAGEKTPTNEAGTNQPRENLHEAHRHDYGAHRPGSGRSCSARARHCRSRL